MSSLTQDQQQRIRSMLKQRAAELRRDLASHRQGHERADAEPGVADTKDLALSESADAVGDAEIERDRDELRQIEAAFQRLESGRYGECAECGEAIDASRLQAQPAATRCLKCQQRVEDALHREGR